MDFDPVRRQGRGSAAGEMDAETAALFPDGFEDSELGKIPRGWNVSTIGDLAEVSGGKRPVVRYPSASADASIPLWGGNGPMAFVPEALVDSPSSTDGKGWNVRIVFRITTPCWPSDNTLILRLSRQSDLEYAFLQLRRVDFAALNRGSTQPLLTQTDLKTQPLLLPPAALRDRFHSFAHGLYQRADASVSESHTLEALRDSLLPKLLSGEISIGGSALHLPEIAGKSALHAPGRRL